MRNAPFRRTFTAAWLALFIGPYSLAADRCSSRILVMGDGNFLSHASRPLEIAKELRARGHDVHFAIGGKYTSTVIEQGFQPIPLTPSDAHKIESTSRAGFCNWFSPTELDDCITEDRHVINYVKPDLIVSDFRFSALTSAEAEGVPHALIVNASWTNYLGRRLSAPDGFFLTKILGKGITNEIVPLLKWAILKHGVWNHNTVRSDLDLPKAHNLFNLFERSATLGLIADIPSYGPLRWMPPHYHYVGPLTWEPPQELDPRVGDWNPNQPSAYVTMGSTGEIRYLRLVVKALEEMNVQCLVSTGKLGDIVPTSASTIVQDVVPGLKAAEATDLVVCQGGNGTIYQALMAGRPIVGIPVLHDQEFNMDQVRAIGMGVSLRERGLTTKVIQRSVESVLANRSATNARAAELSAEFQQYRGALNAADVIDEFLRARP